MRKPVGTVRAISKAIERSSSTKIVVDLLRNGTYQFIITGSPSGVEKALNEVKYEFVKVRKRGENLKFK